MQRDEARRLGIPVAFENSLGMRFVLVPAGTFLMGSPEGEAGRGSDETQHAVTLPKPYYVGVTEVTNSQFRRFRPEHDSGVYEVAERNTLGLFERNVRANLNRDAQPVVGVPHDHALAFAAWLTWQDGSRTYRLPTEEEWEHACRAGKTTRFSFGDRDEDLTRYGNFSDMNEPSGPSGQARPDLDDGHGVSAPVGSYQPNPWGLYDMHGNVWEWCADFYGEYPSGATDPKEPSNASGNVLRGGSWNHGPSFARAAARHASNGPGDHGFNSGFRVVVEVPPRG